MAKAFEATHHLRATMTGGMAARRFTATVLRVHAPWRSLAGSPYRERATRLLGTNTVDPRETAKFEEDAASWWDETKGPFAPLHAMNPTRCVFVRDVLVRHFQGSVDHPGVGKDPARPLAGLKLLDVGCGGGILCESLARMGAMVTGVDAGGANVEIAIAHCKLDPAIEERITYRAAAAETLLEEGASFDAVCSLEVVEHVSDPDSFVEALSGLAKPNGAVVVSTLNRTARAAALVIAFAERVVQWVPPGTHEFAKFITPEELVALATRAGLETMEMAGMSYTPPLPGNGNGATGGRWSLTDDLGVNYIAYFAKKKGGKIGVGTNE